MDKLTPPQTASTQDFDPRAAETFSSAHELYAEMRQRCPVAHSEAWNGFWALLRYADVVEVLSDYRRYTTSVQNVVPKLAFTGRRPPLHLDPPEHTSYRRVINEFFTSDKVAALAPAVRRDTVALLQPLIDAGRCDISADFAHKIPAYVFAEFFNLPVSMATTIKEVSTTYVGAIRDANDELVRDYSKRLYDIARDIIAQRQAAPMDPRQDLTSALLEARHEGQLLPAEMVLGTVRQLIVTGMIAPSVFIGNIFVHLSEHPQLQEQLRRDPSLIPAALEEYLRLFTPYRGMSRTAREDVEFGGRLIRKDEPIALVYASANRDEAVFKDGDQFILNRPNIKEHIAFGKGPHQCPGAPLARTMLQIMMEEVLARTKHISVDGAIEMTRWPEWGTNSVPVRLVPA